METKSDSKSISRRRFLSQIAVGSAGAMLAACQPPAPQVVEKTVVVEKPVDKIVESTKIVTQEKVITATPRPTVAAQKAFIRFVTQETDPGQITVMREMIAAFEAENPGSRVEMDVSGPDNIYARMAASMAAGATSVDVIQPNPAMAFMLASKNMLLPIDDIVEQLGGDSMFYDNSVMKWKGKRYGIPFGGGTAAIFYRKDLFEKEGVKVPTTWEELRDVAKRFTKKFNPNSPTEFGICMSYSRQPATQWFAQPLWWSNGAEMFDKDLNLAIKSDQTAEFLDYYNSLFEYVPPNSANFGWGEFINTLLAGQVAMSPYLGRTVSRIYNTKPEMVGKIGAFEYPKRKLRITTDDPNYYIIAAATPYPDACKKWVKFTLTGDWQYKFICQTAHHMPPATKDQVKWWNQDKTGCDLLDKEPVMKKLFGDLVEVAYNPITNTGGVLEAIKQGKSSYVSTGVANPFILTSEGTAPFMPWAIQKVTIEKKPAKKALEEVEVELMKAIADAKKEIGWQG